jgi:hypothetical protein
MQSLTFGEEFNQDLKECLPPSLLFLKVRSKTTRELEGLLPDGCVVEEFGIIKPDKLHIPPYFSLW